MAADETNPVSICKTRQAMISTLLLALSTAPADILDVHPTAGPYTEIIDAVVAAEDGDVVRVAPGTYGSFAVVGKGITVVAPSGATVLGVVRVQDLDTSQLTVVQNLTIWLAPDQNESRLIVGNNAGSVRLEDLTIEFDRVDEWGFEKPGARILNCADVTLVGCSISNAWAPHWSGYGANGAPGVRCTNSTMSIYGGDFQAIGAREPGLSAHGSEIVAVGLRSWGADGTSSHQNGIGGSCEGEAGPGGHGISLEGSHCELAGCDLHGGGGGVENCWINGGPFTLGAGTPIWLDSLSSLVTHDTPSAPFLDVTQRVAPESSDVGLTVVAEPSDRLLLLESQGAHLWLAPKLVGNILVGRQRFRRSFIGVGSGTYQYSLPALAPGTVSSQLFQVLHIRSSPNPLVGRQFILGPPRVVTVEG